MTTPEDLPSIAELTRLANEFFSGLPGSDDAGSHPPQAMPDLAPGTALGLAEPTVSELAAIPWALSDPGTPPYPVTAPLVAGDPAAALVPGGPVPLPTPEELAAIPRTLTDMLAFVPGLPGDIVDGNLDGLEPPALPLAVPLVAADVVPDYLPSAGEAVQALAPAALPGAPTSQQVPDAGQPVRHAAPDAAGSATRAVGSDPVVLARVGAFQFAPELVPNLEGLPATVRPFDAEAIRRDFPLLANERVNGSRIVWLDNGATTQKPQAVIDRVSYFYEHENSNIHRAAHTMAARATDAYEGARDKVARFINAGDSSRIVFVRGATEGINLVAKSWGAAHVAEGDEILITHLEHHANIVPWQQLCAQTGAKLVVAPVDDTGQIILSEFERLLSEKTKMVAFTAVSNALGTITPAVEMTQLAHQHGAKVLIDAAQLVLHARTDVQALACDFLVFSGHKVFAPTGIGVVYGTEQAWEETPPWQGGGNMIADVTFERTTYQSAPNRFEAGTGSIADAVGLGAALDYLTAVGIEAVAAHEQDVLRYGTQRLLTVPGLRIIGTAERKAGVMSFVLAGHRSEDVGAALDRESIAVRAGHHCAQPILRCFGVESTVRPALALYNTREDIDLLIDALQRIVAGRLPGP